MTKNMIKIQGGLRSSYGKLLDYCPLNDSTKDKIDGSCNHPLMGDVIQCQYGVTEAEVPENCPLRNESLLIKLMDIEETISREVKEFKRVKTN